MKNKIISGAAAIFLGLLFVLGPQFLFKACDIPDDGLPQCHWAVRAEICTGLLITALGIFLIIFSDYKTRMGLTVGVFLTGIVAFIIPIEQFIGVCKEAEAVCRKVTFPALIALSVLVVAGAVINMVYLEKKTKI